METSRCWGLTETRQRCDALATDQRGYCAQHQSAHPHAEPVRVQKTWARRLLAKMRGPVFEARVPDDVTWPIPSSLRRRPLASIIAQLLNGADATARWSAAYALRRRRDPAALEPLWHVLQHEPVALVRQQAAVALGKIAMPAVVSPLIEALWHDRDPGVRQACAIALGNLGDPRVARDIAAVLMREQTIFVRWDCVLALGQLGDRAYESFLTELARTERTQVIVRACHDALAQLRRHA